MALDMDAFEAVREKIGRKLDVAKTFGGLLTLALTVILGALLDPTKLPGFGDRLWALQVSAGLYLLSAVFFMSAMYAYDSLLMPRRFWGEAPAGRGEHRRSRRWLVERPPSSSAWILYQNMMRIWTYRFTVAVVVVLIATGLLGYGALRVNTFALVATTMVAAPVVFWWLWRTRPVLGSND
jgi:hypothetical protein